MESQIFRDISTELDLNGPYLAFATQPSDQTADNGDSISYTGIATNSYGISGSPENIVKAADLLRSKGIRRKWAEEGEGGKF